MLRNPDIPLRAPDAQRSKWAAQQRRPTILNEAQRRPPNREHEHSLGFMGSVCEKRLAPFRHSIFFIPKSAPSP